MRKRIILLLWQLLFASSLAVHFDQEVCQENQLLPHESRCEIYYLCSNGEYSIRDCPSGLHFNAELKVCDYPEAADCQLIESKEPPPPINIECPNDESELYLPHPDCNRFYLWVQNCNRIRMPWRSALECEREFLRLARQCKLCKRWRARDQKYWVINNSPTRPKSDCPPGEDSGVTLPHPDCSRFYLCVWVIPKEIEGHNWNVQQNYVIGQRRLNVCLETIQKSQDYKTTMPACTTNFTAEMVLYIACRTS